MPLKPACSAARRARWLVAIAAICVAAMACARPGPPAPGRTLTVTMHPDQNANFVVDANVDPDLPLIAGDRATLELMLDNLVDNAIRHSRNLGHLHLSAFARGDQVVLEVADRGGGIAHDEVKLVTQKFYRGRETAHGGTGFGLSIVKRIATEHAGTVAIRSEPGQGTTVTVTFPRLMLYNRSTGSPPVAVPAS